MKSLGHQSQDAGKSMEKEGSSTETRPRQAPPWRIGYCTNVHAGPSLEQAQANLQQYAVPIRQSVTPNEPLPVGLWLAEPAAKTLAETGNVSRFRDWLEQHQLFPFTFNGFPQGDFHQPVVKHRVYLPTWDDPARRDYTLLLIDHLHHLLPAGEIGSISTLPLGWGTPAWTDQQFTLAALHLSEVAQRLQQLEETTGRYIVLAIEPEPGCVLDTAQDMCQFFSRYLSAPATSQRNRRYLTVCHDICHAAVMFESQQDFFDQLRKESLLIGKVQVSAALEVRWNEMDDAGQSRTLEFLSQFAEDRYLHQTGVCAHNHFQLWEDLPQLLNTKPQHMNDQSWRVHFHVPISEARIGELHSTQAEIVKCIELLQSPAYCDLCPTGHLEVETYAWSVIPAHLRQTDLAASISRELNWLRSGIANSSQSR
jgi:hypothetical protein